MRTRRPFCKSQKQTLDRFVDLPTPLTPTNVRAYGSGGASGDDSDEGAERFRWISSKMSVDVFGVSTRVSDVESAFCTSVLTPVPSGGLN